QPQVQVAIALDHRDLLASATSAEQHGDATLHPRVGELEWSTGEAAFHRAGKEPLHRGQRFAIVARAHGRDERLGILRHGEEGEPLVGIESVLERGARIERVESEGLRELARRLVEYVREPELRGRGTVRRHAPRAGGAQKQRRAGELEEHGAPIYHTARNGGAG